MKRSDRLQVLESRFERELAKRTEILTRSLHLEILGGPKFKREVFDAGLREWASSLAEAVGQYLPRFMSCQNEGAVERRLENAEREIRQNLYEFLGVPDLKPTDAWPISCRVLKFTATVCDFAGYYRRPAWFDLGNGPFGPPDDPPLPLKKQFAFEIQTVVFGDFATTLEKELRDLFDDGLIDATAAATTKLQRSRHTEEGGLPDKQRDLSDHFDDAKLTPRQREVASLRWEYGMRIGDIAKYLGLHRSTVDESLKAAKRRMDQSRENDRNRRRSAPQKPAT